MSRQILTFVLVFVALMFLMRSCDRGPPPAPPVPREMPGQEKETFVLERDGGPQVVLAPDGSVVSLRHGADLWIRPAPAPRRPFHVLRKDAQGLAQLLDPAGWTSEALPDGRRFTWRGERGTLTKTVRLAADGAGLEVELALEGAGTETTGLILTGASGVVLSGPDDAERSFAFVKLAGKTPQIEAWQKLVQEREAEPGRGYAAYVRLAPDERVERFGILGRTAYVALEGLPAASELYLDVYRAVREEGETEEIETWTDLVARDGAYTGAFRLRWRPRADAPPELGGTGELRPETLHELEDDTFRIVLTDRGAAVREMWLKPFSAGAGEDPSPDTWIPIVRHGVRAGERALTLGSSRTGGNPAHDTWRAERPDARSILFTLETPAGWTLRKRVTLPEPGRYDLGVGIEAVPPPDVRAEVFEYALVGPAGSYIEDAYRGIIGAEPPEAFLLERSGGSNEEETIDALVKGDHVNRAYGENRGLLHAVGTRGAYFCVALVTEERRDASGRLEGTVAQVQVRPIVLNVAVPREDGEASRDSMAGRISCRVPVRDGAARERYRFYAGPNEVEALRELGIEDAIDFGMFAFIGRALMWLMKLYAGGLGSFGVAVMLLTVTVRAVLLPVSFRMQLSMQRYGKRLQKIKPLLDDVQKKFANNPQKLQAEKMKVMREHGVGLPLGCMTIFLQIPIWFALFQALRVEFALRHQSFLWVEDLSMPDRLFGLPFWPHWFNLLPILMLVLWVVQQRLTPTPGSADDPQVKMQMKMMRFMPYVFFFMLYKYAAALALYMCVSSLWSIAESKLVRRAVARLDA